MKTTTASRGTPGAECRKSRKDRLQDSAITPDFRVIERLADQNRNRLPRRPKPTTLARS